MILFNQLDRYIGRSILLSTMVILAVLLALLTFFLMLDGLSDLGKGQFTIWVLIKFVILSLPRKLYDIFPVVCLLGSITGLSALALNSELIVIRAAGVSVLRIIGSVFKTGLVLVVVGMLFGEFIVPASDQRAQRTQAEALNVGLHRKGSGIWLRDKRAFINIGDVLPDESLLKILIFEFDSQGHLRIQRRAEKAIYKGNQWQLVNVVDTSLGRNAVLLQRSKQQPWDVDFTPDVMSVFALKPESMSIAHLYRYIQHLQKNKQNTDRYRLVFWNKVFMPIAIAVMILLAMPFVFGQLRSGGMGQRVFIGIMLGLGFIIISRGIGLFAVVAGVPPFLGASAPIALFLCVALLLLRRLVR